MLIHLILNFYSLKLSKLLQLHADLSTHSNDLQNILVLFRNPTGDTLAHLKLVKAEQAGFIAYLHGNRRYGVIGDQFPQRSFWKALFPSVDPCKQ